MQKYKENQVLKFFVYPEPANIQGYAGFGMIIRLAGGNSGSHQKTAERVYEELERNSVMALPMIIQEGVMVWQLIVKSLFEIDPAMKKIESLNGVKGADVFIPLQSRPVSGLGAKGDKQQSQSHKGRPFDLT